MSLDDVAGWGVDPTWTLFLDRDGVLNRRIVGGYVLKHTQYEWLPGVLPALAILTERFGRTVVVTNQQGVGKGLMTADDLVVIHRKLLEQARYGGAQIDAVLACTSLASVGDPRRKPGTGMADEARERFPEIDLRRSVMVGDSPSDIAFGRAAGMRTVFIGSAGLSAEEPDAHCASLWDLALALRE